MEKAEGWGLQGQHDSGARVLRMCVDAGRAREVNGVRGGRAPIFCHPPAYSPPLTAVKGKLLQTASPRLSCALCDS